MIYQETPSDKTLHLIADKLRHPKTSAQWTSLHMVL
jgi:hypothetical protein